jgi:hypothetical protein
VRPIGQSNPPFSDFLAIMNSAVLRKPGASTSQSHLYIPDLLLLITEATPPKYRRFRTIPLKHRPVFRLVLFRQTTLS